MIKTTRACLLLPLLLMACQGPQKQASTPRTLLTSPQTTSSPTVQVNGQPLASGVTLNPGDTITIRLPAAPPVVVTPPAPDPVPPVVITPPPAPIPVPPTPNVAGTWAPLATEGKTFTLSNPSRVRYGLDDTWNIKDNLVGTLTCGNGVFGDPSIGNTKVCELFVPTVEEAKSAPPVVYDPPLVITKGGTYSGRWASTNPDIPAVTIKTSEPVVLENCAVRGPSHLISARWVHARLTVRNCLGEDTSDETAKRFIVAEGAVSLVVQGNTLQRTGGIYLNGMDTLAAENKLEVTNNRAYNINGLKTNGKEYVQFLQLNHVRGQSGLIAWNRVENQPGESAAEDVINLFDTSGKPGAPISIRNNLIIGAYGTPPESGYSGGGIMLGDGDGAELEAVGNTVIETSNYGVASAGGKNILIAKNTVLGLGKLNDGTILDANPDAGIYARNYSKNAAYDPKTVKVADNVVGWARPKPAKPDARWDYSLTAGTGVDNNAVVPTAELIAQAVRNWETAYAAR